MSLSTLFPSPAYPAHGLFVRRRLEYMAALAEVRVIAPVPWLDYGHSQRRFGAAWNVPAKRQEGALTVYHPHWLHPPLGGSPNAWLMAKQVAGLTEKIRREFPFDLIDAHQGHPAGIAAAKLAERWNCSFTVTLRGNETKLAETPAIRRQMSEAWPRASRIFAVSENLRRLALDLGVAPERAVTIPNGVESEIFHRYDRDAARRRFNLPETGLVVISAGSLCERKGHHRVAEAVAALRAKGRRVTLAIAGGVGREGDYESEIRASTKPIADTTIFLGQLAPTELAEAMSASDLFCLASRQEGWPNVVHEAMACGTPVVATDVGGLREMMPSEQYGFIVNFGDSAALAAAIGRALDTQWDRAVIEAWAHSRSWHQVAREVVDQMRKALYEKGLYKEGKIS